MTTPLADRPYDIVLQGASGYVGVLVAEYLLSRQEAEGLSWALAGRNQSKLEAVRSGLGAAGADLPILIADARDRAALDRLADQARVVISTVGPYALYGSDLVAACAAHGTDYVDLTGEPAWIRRMIDAHHVEAEQSGARIVPCCGFDSIPSDLGCFFLAQHIREVAGGPPTYLKLRVKAASGGFSGGTVASMLNAIEEVKRDPGIRKVLGNPFALCPEGQRRGPRQPRDGVNHDADMGGWTAPFVMAAINTRVVHRSNALLGYPYGAELRYDEATWTGAGVGGLAKATGIAGGMGGFMGLAVLPPTRWLLERFVLPSPGEGPTPEQREKGFFKIWIGGRGPDGELRAAHVTGDRDPGYGSTAKMIGEAALTLLKDVDRTALAGGLRTPATVGQPLIDRLVAHAGLTFDLVA